MINPFKKLEDWTRGGYTFGDLFEDVGKIPAGYAFHVKRGAGMIGEYVGETLGVGTRELAVKGVGGVKTGLFPKGAYDPMADFHARMKRVIPDKPFVEFPDIIIPDFPTIPDITIPDFPTIPAFPKIDIGMPSVTMPGVPKLTDEEGAPNIPLLIGLGLAGVLILKKV